MAYSDIEVSLDSNHPIELYTFTRGTTTWLYTSTDADVFYLGQTYRSIPIKRSAIEASQDLGKVTNKLTVIRNAPFLTPYIMSAQTGVVQVTITRLHAGYLADGGVVIFQGRVTNVKFLENVAEVTCAPLYTALKRPSLRKIYQVACPHVLYGNGCKVDRTLVMVETLVSYISGNILGSSALIRSGNPTLDDGWYVGGIVEALSGGSLEVRFITNYDKTTGRITLNLPFSGIGLGASIKVYPGCDHTTTSCLGKFNNILNYGGFPFIPTKNPMDGTPIF